MKQLMLCVSDFSRRLSRAHSYALEVIHLLLSSSRFSTSTTLSRCLMSASSGIPSSFQTVFLFNGTNESSTEGFMICFFLKCFTMIPWCYRLWIYGRSPLSRSCPVYCPALLSVHPPQCDGGWLWHSLLGVHVLQIFHIGNQCFLHIFHARFIVMDEIPMFQHVSVCDLEWVDNGRSSPSLVESVVFLSSVVSFFCWTMFLVLSSLFSASCWFILSSFSCRCCAALSNTVSSTPREDDTDWSWLGSRVSWTSFAAFSFVLYHLVSCKGLFMMCPVADHPEQILTSWVYDAWYHHHSQDIFDMTNIHSTRIFNGLICECAFLTQWFQAGAQQVDLARQHVSRLGYCDYCPLHQHRLEGLLLLFSTLPQDPVSHFLSADSLWWCAPPQQIEKSEHRILLFSARCWLTATPGRFLPWLSMGIINTTFSQDGNILCVLIFHSWSCHKLSGRHNSSRTSLWFLLRESPTTGLRGPLLQMNVP